jgi:hypothetical protein
MGEFLDFMIPLKIERDIGPEVVRYPVLIPIGIKYSCSAIHVVPRYRQSDRATGTVYNIKRKIYPTVEFVIPYKVQGMWFVIITRIIVTAINHFIWMIPVSFN